MLMKLITLMVYFGVKGLQDEMIEVIDRTIFVIML